MSMLLLFAGLPGTGKTTLAAAYAASEQVLHLNSDVLRNELHLRGKYNNQTKQKVYDELLKRTQIALANGETVVVDSTFHQSSVQKAFVALAEALKVPLFWIETTAAEEILRERLSRSRLDSEADFAVYEQIRDTADALPSNRLILHTDLLGIPDLITKISEFIVENGK